MKMNMKTLMKAAAMFAGLEQAEARATCGKTYKYVRNKYTGANDAIPSSKIKTCGYKYFGVKHVCRRCRTKAPAQQTQPESPRVDGRSSIRSPRARTPSSGSGRASSPPASPRVAPQALRGGGMDPVQRGDAAAAAAAATPVGAAGVGEARPLVPASDTLAGNLEDESVRVRVSIPKLASFGDQDLFHSESAVEATLTFRNKNKLSFSDCDIEFNSSTTGQTHVLPFEKKHVKDIEFLRSSGNAWCCPFGGDVVQANGLSKFFEWSLFPITKLRLLTCVGGVSTCVGGVSTCVRGISDAVSAGKPGKQDEEEEKKPCITQERVGIAALALAMLLWAVAYFFELFGVSCTKDTNEYAFKWFHGNDTIVVVSVGYLIVSLYIQTKIVSIVGGEGGDFEQLPRFGAALALFLGLFGKMVRFMGNFGMSALANSILPTAPVAEAPETGHEGVAAALGTSGNEQKPQLQQEDFLASFLFSEAVLLYVTWTANIFMAWVGLDFAPKTLGAALGHLTAVICDISVKSLLSLVMVFLYSMLFSKRGIVGKQQWWKKTPIHTLHKFTGWMTVIFYVCTHGVLDVYQNNLVIKTPELTGEWREFFAQKIAEQDEAGASAPAENDLSESAPSTAKQQEAEEKKKKKKSMKSCIANFLARRNTTKWHVEKYGDSTTFYHRASGWSSSEFGKERTTLRKLAASFETSFSTGVFVKVLDTCNSDDPNLKVGALMLLVRSEVLRVDFTSCEKGVLRFIAVVLFIAAVCFSFYHFKLLTNLWPTFIAQPATDSAEQGDEIPFLFWKKYTWSAFCCDSIEAVA